MWEKILKNPAPDYAEKNRIEAHIEKEAMECYTMGKLMTAGDESLETELRMKMKALYDYVNKHNYEWEPILNFIITGGK
tara:strand:+ start:292 stop:528 length:237 start_codon:yes stop_codon:yes gene_type:complete